MRNVKLVVEYDGTDYHGYAVQARQRTVQGELERAIRAVTGEASRAVGSGRTDAGAHALGQVVSFCTASRLTPAELGRALDALLPDDLVVRSAEEVPGGFHARRSAQRRHYRYSLWNAPLPSVFARRYRYHVSDPLDMSAMNVAAECLSGTMDFACFTFGLAGYLAAGRRTTVRHLYSVGWSGEPPALDFDVVGTAFLPHMIRNMVGALLRVGTGRLSPEEFHAMVARRDGRLSTWTAPALGLILVEVEY